MWEGDLSVLPPFSCLDFPFLERSREVQYFQLGKSPDIISPNLGENLFSIFEVQANARKGLREGRSLRVWKTDILLWRFNAYVSCLSSA